MAQMIPALALAIADAFPELGGRSIAVSEIQPFDAQTNFPNLPIAVTALLSEKADQSVNGGGQIRLSPDVIVEFILDPVKYTLEDGQSSPFFAYYDYESLRDRMLVLTKIWRTPRNGAISYRGMDLSSDEFAVYVAFRFSIHEIWCPPESVLEAEVFTPIQVSARVLQPRGKDDCCDPCEELEDPCARPSE